MCPHDSAQFGVYPREKEPYEGPRLIMSRERPISTPLSQTIYPVTLAETPPHIDGDIIHRHSPFLCRAVQDFTGNPKCKERSLRRGELVMVHMSRTGTLIDSLYRISINERIVGWWYISSDGHWGGSGWVPAMHLEKYDPDADHSVYRDNSLDKCHGPLYLYNPFGHHHQSDYMDRASEFVKSYCNWSRFSYGGGMVGVELMDDGQDYYLKTMPSIFEGFPIMYSFQKIDSQKKPRPRHGGKKKKKSAWSRNAWKC
jgi:hypothetical protein